MGPETAKHTPEKIKAIEKAIFEGWPLRVIRANHEITDHALRKLRKEQGWGARRRRVTIRSLVKRLLDLVDQQVVALEALEARSKAVGLDEKPADILAKTAATLQRLIAMDAALQREAKPKPKGMTETQVRLAQRLEELRRR
jgi:hypothetical protein